MKQPPEITVKNLLIYKQKLANEIKDAINSFTEETGVSVMSVEGFLDRQMEEQVTGSETKYEAVERFILSIVLDI